MLVIERFIFSIFFSYILFDQVFSSNSFYQGYKFKTLSKWGKLTYGLYCLHFIGILIAININKKLGFNLNIFGVLFLDTIVAFIVSLLLAYCSFYVLEKPFLKLKKKFSKI